MIAKRVHAVFAIDALFAHDGFEFDGMSFESEVEFGVGDEKRWTSEWVAIVNGESIDMHFEIVAKHFLQHHVLKH